MKNSMVAIPAGVAQFFNYRPSNQYTDFSLTAANLKFFKYKKGDRLVVTFGKKGVFVGTVTRMGKNILTKGRRGKAIRGGTFIRFDGQEESIRFPMKSKRILGVIKQPWASKKLIKSLGNPVSGKEELLTKLSKIIKDFDSYEDLIKRQLTISVKSPVQVTPKEVIQEARKKGILNFILRRSSDEDDDTGELSYARKKYREDLEDDPERALGLKKRAMRQEDDYLEEEEALARKKRRPVEEEEDEENEEEAFAKKRGFLQSLRDKISKSTGSPRRNIADLQKHVEETAVEVKDDLKSLKPKSKPDEPTKLYFSSPASLTKLEQIVSLMEKDGWEVKMPFNEGTKSTMLAKGRVRADIHHQYNANNKKYRIIVRFMMRLGRSN